MVDLTSIHRVIRTARRRLRVQAALEWAVTASIASSITAMLLVLSMRLQWISEPTLVTGLGLAACAIFIAAALAASRPFSRNWVATKIDRQANLCDRLASACAFEARLASVQPGEIDCDTEALMLLAMDDASKSIGRANPKAATPFRQPKATKNALATALAAVLLALIPVSYQETRPTLGRIDPPAAAREAHIVAHGELLLTPAGPEDTAVLLGEGPGAVAVEISRIDSGAVEFSVPKNFPIGITTVTIEVGGRKTSSLPFEVLDISDPRAIPNENIILEDEDLDFVRDLVAQIRKTSEQNEDLALEEMANKLDKLLDQVERGTLSKQQMLEALSKAEESYMGGSEEAVKESLIDLKKAGKELKRDKRTTAIGKALQAGQIKKAQKEMEKLAKQLQDNDMSEKEAQSLGKALQKAAEKMARQSEKRDSQMKKTQAKREKKIRELEKKRDRAKSRQEREEMVRRLDREKRELRRLQRKKERKQRDASKRELKQLRRKMSEAAKQLQKKPQAQNRQRTRREVSKTMREMAQRTGKVSQDKRKMANKAKVITQMSDLKEAMRRAKRKGKQGAKNRFGRKGARKKDYGARARGGKGQRSAWRPGQVGKNGKGKGKGGTKKDGSQPGQGNGSGGDEYGDGHDPNLMGDPTKMSGNITDDSLQGVRGKGPSTRETILTAAQKGFASRSYENVFVQYKTIVEEVIRAEKVPSGYKHYVQRYFHKIKPVR